MKLEYLEFCQARVSAKHSREQLATQPGAPKAGSAAPVVHKEKAELENGGARGNGKSGEI